MAGLASALYLSRSGHEVVLVERDDTPLPDNPSDAFWWDRRGAAQVRHSHAFLARLRNQLLADHPDVLASLLEAGATEMDFIAMLPEGMDRTPMPGDEQLVALACRRTTFEWVLRRAVLSESTTELRHGLAVSHLRRGTRQRGVGAGADRAPVVTGVALSDGSLLEADLVVLAGGRRMDVPALYAELGTTVEELEEDTGIIYLSQFMRLRDGAELPRQVGPIGGDLGYLKYAVFNGDDRTFSLTFAVDSKDRELRRLLLDPTLFERAAANLPATAAHVDGRAEAITGVEVMGGLINRRRSFTDSDGQPLLTGAVAVGDAHTATNPLYGRGCSLALVQARALAAALDRSTGSLTDVAAQYEAESQREVEPWYRAAVSQDRMARTAAQGRPTNTSGPISTSGPTSTDEVTRAEFMRSLLREGLFPAMRVDPVVLRAFLAMFNLLRAPDSLMTDSDVIGRVMAVYQDRDNRAPEPALGPAREELLECLAQRSVSRPQPRE